MQLSYDASKVVRRPVVQSGSASQRSQIERPIVQHAEYAKLDGAKQHLGRPETHSSSMTQSGVTACSAAASMVVATLVSPV